MLTIPEIDDVSIAFGRIDHMPKFNEVPENFKAGRGNPYNDLFSKWFYSGLPNGLEGEGFYPKEGVDKTKALRAIKAVMASWEPKHEHKEAAVAYMLSEWFDIKK